jgi:DNA-binding winged helix-turn-helix (wHTH) protein
MLEFCGVRVDPATRRVWRGTREIRLTKKAFDLLELLVQKRPNAVSKQAIHARLWPDTFVAEITLHSLISDLRRALGDDAAHPRFIRTFSAFGYAFIGAPEQNSATPRRVRGWLVGDEGRVSLFDGENALGRGGDDVIELASTTVSRRHASIRFDDDAWLADLGSKNGTFVGDVRVTDAVRLADGDRVRFGSAQFTFRLSRTSGAATTQSTTGVGTNTA